MDSNDEERRVKRGFGLVVSALSETSRLRTEPVEKENRTIYLVGECPACGHEMDKVIRQRHPEDRAWAKPGKTARFEVLVYCNCSTVHPDQPPGRAGCGRYGWLTVESASESADAHAIAARTALPDDLRWELRAEQLYASRLSDTRATAEKWTTGVTSVTGVFGIVALVKGPETIGMLHMPWRWIVYFLVIAAVLLALSAIGLAGGAAGGSPRVARLSGREAQMWDGWQASAAKRELIYSRRVAFAAVVAMLTAIAITWFGPTN